MTVQIDCRDVELQLAPYVAGELAVAEHRRIQLHMAECVGCCEELARLRAVAHLLRRSRIPAVIDGACVG